MRIGALIGILSVVLSLILPELFGWYMIGVSSMGITGRGYITGFGTLVVRGPGFESAADLAILVLIGGILIIIGAILCIASGEVLPEVIGIIGGILMLVGPMLLIIDLLAVVSEVAEATDRLVDVAGGTIFGGSHFEMGYKYIWGLYLGFYILIAAGVLGLIGGIMFFLRPSKFSLKSDSDFTF